EDTAKSRRAFNGIALYNSIYCAKYRDSANCGGKWRRASRSHTTISHADKTLKATLRSTKKASIIWAQVEQSGGLFHFLVRIDAPKPRLLDPAVEALADEAAPAVLAALHAREHAVLKLCADRARGFRLVVQRQQFVPAFGLR